MKTLRYACFALLPTVLALTLATSQMACPGVTGAQIKAELGQIGGRCALPGVAKLASQILPEVVGALISGNWSGLLDQIVATLRGQGVEDALGVVTCAVATVESNGRNIPPGAALSPMVLHARMWLKIHPIPDAPPAAGALVDAGVK